MKFWKTQNPRIKLINLLQILIGELGRTTGMFLAWQKEKTQFPGKAGFLRLSNMLQLKHKQTIYKRKNFQLIGTSSCYKKVLSLSLKVSTRRELITQMNFLNPSLTTFTMRIVRLDKYNGQRQKSEFCIFFKHMISHFKKLNYLLYFDRWKGGGVRSNYSITISGRIFFKRIFCPLCYALNM